VTTKGSLTSIAVSDGEKYPYEVTKRQVMWTDGYDAWLCVFNGIGDSPRNSYHKPTSYRFTYYYPNRNILGKYNTQKVITLSKGHTLSDYQRVKERTMELHKAQAGQLIAGGFKLTWLDLEESKECLEYYMEHSKEPIDLDEKTNDELLALCRAEARKNGFKDCESGCKLKFLCWTHRSQREELDKKYRTVV